MNRTTYILIALAAMIAFSCTKATYPMHQEDLSTPYIFFDAEILQTKSNLLTGTSLPSAQETAFGVFGYRGDQTAYNDPVFSNNRAARMYRQEAGGSFIYDNLALWTPDVNHHFCAYYPYENSCMNAVYDGTNKPYITYTQPTSLETMVDLMTAYVTGQKASTNPVQLNFQHRLFALDVIIRNMHSVNENQPEESLKDLVITGATIQFNDIAESASLYFDEDYTVAPTGSITISQVLVTEQFSLPAPTTEDGTKERNLNSTTGPFLLIPCGSMQVSFTLKFINAWNEECECTISNLIEPQGGFKQGHQYTLYIDKKCSDEEITFEASVQDYTDNKIDINIEYN